MVPAFRRVRAARACRAALELALLAGCGARTGLEAPDRDAQLGTRDVPDGSAPRPQALEVRTGSFGTHFCALLTDHTVRCWGRNFYGQLGLPRERLDQARPVPVAGLRDVAHIAVSQESSCAATLDGRVHCWGHNLAGELGDGTTVSRHEVRAVAGLTEVVGLSATAFEVCAVRRDGGVWCWGSNGFDGHDGTTTTAIQTTPLQVSALRAVRELASGGAHHCARTDDDEVLCWGMNTCSQLGFEPPVNTSRVSWPNPVSLGRFEGMRELRTGSCATGVLRADRSVVTWGLPWDDRYYESCGGQIEVSTRGPDERPGFSPAEHLWLGSGQTCVNRQDGEVQCCGSEGAGSLGNGRTVSDGRQDGRASIVGVRAPIELALGLDASCLILADGDVACAGYFYHGQSGDGTFGVLRPIFQRVAW